MRSWRGSAERRAQQPETRFHSGIPWLVPSDVGILASEASAESGKAFVETASRSDLSLCSVRLHSHAFRGRRSRKLPINLRTNLHLRFCSLRNQTRNGWDWKRLEKTDSKRGVWCWISSCLSGDEDSWLAARGVQTALGVRQWCNYWSFYWR